MDHNNNMECTQNRFGVISWACTLITNSHHITSYIQEKMLSCPLDIVGFLQKAIYHVELHMLSLKTSRPSPSSCLFDCSGHSKINCIYMQETHACWILMFYPLIYEFRKCTYTFWILILNFFEFDTLPIAQSERMRT